MGLGCNCAGTDAVGGNGLKVTEQGTVVALAGNPNVGKSTVFNSLTGMNQHTGNWPGKTVSNARGKYRFEGKEFILVDLPGTYSLMANSAEEEVARDFICFGEPDVTTVVADATCMERNLNLILQTMEMTDRVVVCVNLLDEAKKKGIKVNLDLLAYKLGVPVIGTTARSGKGLNRLMQAIEKEAQRDTVKETPPVVYSEEIEEALSLLTPILEQVLNHRLKARWTALKLLEGDTVLLNTLKGFLGFDLLEKEEVAAALEQARISLQEKGYTEESFRDAIVTAIVERCEELNETAVIYPPSSYDARSRKIDRVLTSKLTGIPIMLLLLFGIFWLTITGANYPSQILADFLFSLETPLSGFLSWANAPDWLNQLLVSGMYKTLAWVVSVMLPPMAIFFPLFTLLEDLGYLPRVAFNLDYFFCKANAHGKQALTMMMGFGCNAAGVIGCRIIDSPRERLIATLTNVFVPCNGRFPTLIAIITMFFAGAAAGPYQSLFSTLILTGVIVFSVLMTLFISKLLSVTILKGLPSSFNLELPPYRRPQIGKVIVRSVCDRTLFVLWRAIKVAAPAGIVIWILANIMVGDASVLTHCATFLDPFARSIGLDGYILMAFILGFPANEIVVPLIIMSYMAAGTLTDYESLAQLHTLFVQNGWTWLTALCVMLFSLMHWPCGTTCFTIHKETGSKKWAWLSAILPTAVGVVICFIVNNGVRLLGLVG